eukprot:6901367-Prymnesium_polylepis.1
MPVHALRARGRGAAAVSRGGWHRRLRSEGETTREPAWAWGASAAANRGRQRGTLGHGARLQRAAP